MKETSLACVVFYRISKLQEVFKLQQESERMTFLECQRHEERLEERRRQEREELMYERKRKEETDEERMRQEKEELHRQRERQEKSDQLQMQMQTFQMLAMKQLFGGSVSGNLIVLPL